MKTRYVDYVLVEEMQDVGMVLLKHQINNEETKSVIWVLRTDNLDHHVQLYAAWSIA